MIQFFIDQLDFIYLVYGLAFFILAVVTFLLSDRSERGRFWLGLCLFGIVHGVNKWLGIVVPVFVDAPLANAFRDLTLIVSFICLMEFGRRGVVWSGGRRAGLWIYVPSLLLILLAARFGWASVVATACYGLGWPAGILAAMALWQRGWPAAGEKRAPRYIVAPLSLVAFAVLHGLIVPCSGIWPADVFNMEWFDRVTGVPIQVIRFLVVCVLDVAILREYHIRTRMHVAGAGCVRIHRAEAMIMGVSLLVLGAGWLITEGAGIECRRTHEADLMNHVRILAAVVNPANVRYVTEHPEAANSPAYQRLRTQCERIDDIGEEFLYVCVLGMHDRRPVFLVDSESGRRHGRLEYAGRAMSADACFKVLNVFRTGTAALTNYGPKTQLALVTAYAPIQDEGTGRVLAVLGIEAAGERWLAAIRYYRLVPLLITALILFMVIFLSTFWLKGAGEEEVRNVTVQRAQRQQMALYSLSTSIARTSSNVFPALREITEKASAVLGADRVGLFAHDPGEKGLLVEDVYDAGSRTHSMGEKIQGRCYPQVLAILESDHLLALDDCERDARYSELKDMMGGGIRSIMVVPVRAFGEGGVLIVGQCGQVRAWLHDEVWFAGRIADQVSHAWANAERYRAEEALARTRDELEMRVRERTVDLNRKNFELNREIEERRRLEEEHHTLEIQMKEKQKLEYLGVMAGGIAHDFNNILMAILGNVELAMSEAEDHTLLRDYLRDIERAASRAAHLSRQMLAYSGHGHGQVVAIDINHLVTKAVEAEQGSTDKNILIRCECEANLPAVDGDPVQLDQIVTNLLVNAREAIGNAPGQITVRTGTIWCDPGMFASMGWNDPMPEGRYVFVDVADTGCGMDEVTRARMFDPFYTTKFIGRGLGLAAVLGTVKGHRGAIDVHSEVGKGTRFRVLFPIGRLARKEEPCAHRKGVVVSGGTILLVDDEEPIRVLGKKMIESLGFQVLLASDGVEAIELFRKNRDDIRCVLLDLSMPRMDGKETLEIIRQSDPAVKVIMCSGYNQEDVVPQFRDWNLAGFLQKPYLFESLSRLIQEVLGEG